MSKNLSYYNDKELAADYVYSRPAYPSELIERIIDYLKSSRGDFSGELWDKMLDVGCGSGQATRLFASYFKAVLGFDISPDQVEVGRATTKEPNITYAVADASYFPAENGSVDFINCATALHWMDVPKFLTECERVLKPGGCVAIYVYNVTSLRIYGSKAPSKPEEWNEEWLALFREWLQIIRGDPVNELWLTGYRGLYEEIDNPQNSWIRGVWCERELNWNECRRLFSSKGEYRKLLRELKPEKDPLDEFMFKIKSLLGAENKPEEEIRVVLTIYFPTIVFSKPQYR